MTLFKLNHILTISIVISLFLTVGCASDQYGYDDWDYNDDDLIENDEFDQYLYDSDYYSDWDSDGDGILTEDEWGVGTESWGDYDGNVGFSDWDLNNDNELTEDEFNDGYFDTVDDDDNNTIDSDEWNVFY